MQRREAKELLERYLNGNCTPKEKGLLETWYLKYEAQDLSGISQKRRDKQLNVVWENLRKENKKELSRTFRRLGVAATFFLVFFSTTMYLISRRPTKMERTNQADVLPGGNRALLVLSNGRQINLTDAKKGIIANDANIQIEMADSGTVTYRNNKDFKSHQMVFNTIKTPRGGTWKVILPDGSKAVLDAASSIFYPVQFMGNERTVTITGQVYFEVKHNSQQKFKVVTDGQTIEDLGTHFDVMAYNDETQIKTTLIEGKIQVFNRGHNIIMNPGEQSIIERNKAIINLKTEIDLEKVMAWKNGTFSFNNTSLHELMRQSSRWYNVEIVYKGNVKDELFY